MSDRDHETEFLRESLKTCSERLAEYKELLRCSIGILKSKQVIVLKKDDEFRSTLEEYIEKCVELGVYDG